MKIKRVFIVIFLLFISLIVINSNVSVEEANETKIEIKDDLNNKNKNMIRIYDPYYGGGVIPGSFGGIGYGAGIDAGGISGGSGGGAVASVIALSYYLSQEGAKFFDSLDTNSYKVESVNPTIDDVLSNPGIKKAMDEYGWTKADLIKELEMMIDTTCSKFFNDKEIKVYLGASDYELKYSDYRDNNHQYAFSTTQTKWDDLVSRCTSTNYKAYDKIWVINVVYLQMAIINNATFVLVTPTYKYYNYDEKVAYKFPLKNNPNEYYTPFYGRELEYINKAGYQWDKFYEPKVETKR